MAPTRPIGYMKELMPRRRTSRSSSITFPVEATRRTSEGGVVEKFKANRYGLECPARADFANQKRLGVIPDNAQTDRLAG